MSLGNAIHNDLTNLLASLNKEMQFMRTPAMVMAKQRQIDNVNAILDTIEYYQVADSLPAWTKRLDKQINNFYNFPSTDEPNFASGPLVGWERIESGRLV